MTKQISPLLAKARHVLDLIFFFFIEDVNLTVQIIKGVEYYEIL